MKLKLSALIILACIYSFAQQYDNICSPIGWGTYNGSIRGGEGGDTIIVNTFNALKSNAEDTIPKVIILNGSVGNGGGSESRIYIHSNKTILGKHDAELHGSFKIDHQNNIIVRNLKVRGDGAHDANGEDAIEVQYGTRIWFDHLEVIDGGDGNLDIKRESNYITISWCKFSYTSSSTAHKFSNLIGASDSHTFERGKLKITLHHNYWAEGVSQRMPRVRFGQVHIFNNYYRSTGNDYCIGAGYEADLLIENNVFEHINNPLKYIGGAATAVELNNNLFINAPGNKTGTGNAFTPPYNYKLTAVEEVENLVKNGAGTTNLDSLLCGEPINTDCIGKIDGDATIDECGVCSGGTTGKTPCTSIIEAETACATDGESNEDKNAGFSGTGYVNTDNELGTAISWMIHSDSGQTVELELRFANGSSSARPGMIYVNDVVGNSTTFSPTSSWENWTSEKVNIELNKGLNKIDIVATTSNGLANLDYLALFNSSVYSAPCNDCHGELFGFALFDSCNICSGGTTGITPNDDCIITSTNQVKNNFFHIYPNPTVSIIHFSKQMDFKIYDSAGKLLISDHGSSADISKLSSGIYYLKGDGYVEGIIKK